MMKSTREQCAFERGEQAKRRGADKSENPHKVGSVDHAAWLQGWNSI